MLSHVQAGLVAGKSACFPIPVMYCTLGQLLGLKEKQRGTPVGRYDSSTLWLQGTVSVGQHLFEMMLKYTYCYLTDLQLEGITSSASFRDDMKQKLPVYPPTILRSNLCLHLCQKAKGRQDKSGAFSSKISRETVVLESAPNLSPWSSLFWDRMTISGSTKLLSLLDCNMHLHTCIPASNLTPQVGQGNMD